MSVSLDFGTVLTDWSILLVGLGWTVALTMISAAIGLPLGVLFAGLRTGGPLPLRIAIGAYVELIRNTPFIVQLFFVFFGLPAAGLRLSPELASSIAMVINLSAYMTEIVRAGLAATPRGQLEAATSLALTPIQAFVHVVAPPALRRVWPAIVGQIVIVMLGSAVCGQISVPELTFAANLIQSRNFRSFEAFIIAAVLYLALAVVLRRIMRWAGPSLIFGR